MPLTRLHSLGADGRLGTSWEVAGPYLEDVGGVRELVKEWTSSDNPACEEHEGAGGEGR